MVIFSNQGRTIEGIYLQQVRNNGINRLSNCLSRHWQLSADSMSLMRQDLFSLSL